MDKNIFIYPVPYLDLINIIKFTNKYIQKTIVNLTKARQKHVKHNAEVQRNKVKRYIGRNCDITFLQS